MFEKIKENEYVQKFIELWEIPRYRSLIKLGIYIIFFAFVIASINTNSTNDLTPTNTNKVDVMEAYEEMSNYQYRVTTKNEIENEDKQIITFNDNSYYYNNINLYKRENDVYKLSNDNLSEFAVWRFSPSFITNLIQKGEFESKTEYADGIIANTYLIKVEDFLMAYYNTVTTDDRTFKLTIYQSEKQVTKVELDITNIYNMSQYANSYDYEVTLEYSLINQIGPIIVNVESSD